MASAKACDAVFHVDPPPTAKKLRQLLYNVFFAGDHTTHFYALGGPDFIVGPTAPASERNILGVVKKVGLEVGGKVIEMRKRTQAGTQSPGWQTDSSGDVLARRSEQRDHSGRGEGD